MAGITICAGYCIAWRMTENGRRAYVVAYEAHGGCKETATAAAMAGLEARYGSAA